MIPTPTSEPTICHETDCGKRKSSPAGTCTSSEPHACRDCGTAIHDGNQCLECWRDRRDLAMERDRDWWSA